VSARSILVGLAFCPLALWGQSSQRNLGGNVDLGYMSSAGNSSVKTFSFNEKLTWRARQRLTVRQSLRSIYGESNKKTNASLFDLDASADYSLVDGLGVTVGGGFDRNRFAGISRRSEQTVGMSWRFRTLSGDSVRVTAGSSWTQQENVRGESRSFIAMRAGIWYKRQLGQGAHFQQALEGLPNLETRQDWRFNSETSVVAPLSKRLGLKAAYVIRYDNMPERDFQTTDRILTTGLQITY